ncbi:MAG: hypothetical protein FH762_18640 [Firmicutes bacterium]|nr:hypothetical protein [Bacillota bacterium]
MVDNFYNGIRYGDEIEISIGKYNGTAWEYELITHREGFSPDIPEDTEAVYDGLEYKGDKKIRAEKTLTLTQAMPADYGSGLFAYEDLAGLVIKEEIVPQDGSTVDVPARYYTNVNLRKVSTDEVPNEGGFNITISGRYDSIVKDEPAGTESWVKTYT